MDLSINWLNKFEQAYWSTSNCSNIAVQKDRNHEWTDIKRISLISCRCIKMLQLFTERGRYVALGCIQNMYLGEAGKSQNQV